MSATFLALKAALGIESSGGPPPRWADVIADMALATYSNPTPKVERLLLSALEFTGELRAEFDDVSQIPHALTPEEFIRSLAAQTLGDWKGVSCRPTLRRVAATVSSATLVSIIQSVIEKVSAGGGGQKRKEPLAGLGVVAFNELGDQVIREPLFLIRDFGRTALATRTAAGETRTSCGVKAFAELGTSGMGVPA